MAPKRSSPIEDPPKRSTPIEDPPTPTVNKKPPESKVQSFSDDDSGSESDHPPPIVADPSVKPISSKPMNVKKPRSNPATPVKASAKRPVEDSGADAKRAKSKGVEVEGDGSKKALLIERIFQPEHEVSLLSGMLDYSAKNGADPVTDLDGFYLYIKKFVIVEFSKTQLLNKIRRLKKKYKNNVRRKGENVAGGSFSKAVDQELYYLSKNIWGGEGINPVVDHAKSKGKAKKTSQVTQAEKDELLASIPAPKDEELEKREVLKLNSCPSHASSDSFFINKSLVVSSGLDENFLKRAMRLIDGAKRSELEEKWRKLQIDETELFLRRIVLVREQTELVLDAYKK